ncbi:MAG: 7-alpha-hydroxysteroid dehydrogenase [Deltaproteobacteria bacterium]|jgi:7-alpha-hydroxysteroid dehydrogenase|nr:7-alpha-hydroxysteroid dehydrogenase [Deltaproteobacteria bacterium]
MFDSKHFRLDGAVALVTGAGAGIGRAIAETFAGAGAAVGVTDLDEDAAVTVAAGIVEKGGRAFGASCNVLKEEALAAAVDRTAAEFGKLTILVNNAGGGGPKPFDMPMAEMRRAFELNLFSVFRLCQLSAPHMEAAGGGAILNVTSMAAENRNQRMAAYASSKAAESHLTRNIAHDLGPKNIRVNAIAPGATRTQALESMLTPEIERAMLARTPLKRLGEPRDMAYAALFLCSPAASWISGQILTISGGGVQELD